MYSSFRPTKRCPGIRGRTSHLTLTESVPWPFQDPITGILWIVVPTPPCSMCVTFVPTLIILFLFLIAPLYHAFAECFNYFEVIFPFPPSIRKPGPGYIPRYKAGIVPAPSTECDCGSYHREAATNLSNLVTNNHSAFLHDKTIIPQLRRMFQRFNEPINPFVVAWWAQPPWHRDNLNLGLTPLHHLSGVFIGETHDAVTSSS